MKKKLCLSLLFTTSIIALSACSKDGDGGDSAFDGEVKTIYVDGGGDIGDYNTTSSMVKSESNPFPYNTLEKLCGEWEEKHPGYKVKINKTSSKGDRSILEGQLKMKNACHIIYQNGNVINSDLGKDYYVNLSPYLEKPSPYLENNAAWKTVYNQKELATTQAADGDIYYIALEKQPVCFMYNKTLLAKASIDVNTMNVSTLNELCKVMATFQAWQNKQDRTQGYGTYSTLYTWYQLALETNMFSDYVEIGDVIRENGIVDTEEMCRLYKKGAFAPEAKEGNRYYELIKLIQKLDSYKETASYPAAQSWAAGKLAFMEATGSHLRTYSAYELPFEWGTFGFPDISTADYSAKELKGVVRGVAGLGTAWWVSNTAMADGTVDQCVDLLQFLTAPKQNNRLVGDLGGGIPLNPDSDTKVASYLQPLINQYSADIQAGDRVSWTGFSCRAVLGNNFSDNFIRKLQDLDAGTVNLDDTVTSLCNNIKNTVTQLCIENDYDEDSWPALN